MAIAPTGFASTAARSSVSLAASAPNCNCPRKRYQISPAAATTAARKTSRSDSPKRAGAFAGAGSLGMPAIIVQVAIQPGQGLLSAQQSRDGDIEAARGDSRIRHACSIECQDHVRGEEPG